MGIEGMRSCTSVVVGRAATRCGSVIIARNEDNTTPNLAKNFCVVPAGARDGSVLKSPETGLVLTLPQGGLRYTAMPDADTSEGLYEEAGVNSAHVAMSATESASANDTVLAFDPFVEGGLAEDAMLTVVLPYVSTARQGVERLGEIVAACGAAEANGVLFADVFEAWYMEIATGHHWVAQRIPDDAYAVIANQLSIQEVDFDSPDFMASPGIRAFVEAHHLNPHPGRFNFRAIFGTATDRDLHYNTPRVWYGQRLCTPSAVQEPESFDLPFIRRPDFKLGVEDVARVLSSHYDLTEFDPVGIRGTAATRTRYRPIALACTQESHIIQMPPVAHGVAACAAEVDSKGAGADGKTTRGEGESWGGSVVCAGAEADTEAAAGEPAPVGSVSSVGSTSGVPAAGFTSSPVCWLAVGTPGVSPYLPLFTDVERWPAALDGAGWTQPSVENAYWVYRGLQALSTARYGLTEKLAQAFASKQQQIMVQHWEKTRRAEQEATSPAEREALLTQANEELVAKALAEARTQMGTLMKALAESSPLSYTMDASL